MVSPVIFDHEKLDVYQLELKFLTWVTQFLAEMSCKLVERFDPEQYWVRENASGVIQQFEDEDDDEHEDERRPN